MNFFTSFLEKKQTVGHRLLMSVVLLLFIGQTSWAQQGAALDFDGSNDRVKLPVNGLLADMNGGDMSISVWVNIEDDNTQSRPIFSIVENDPDVFQYGIAFGILYDVFSPAGYQPYIALSYSQSSSFIIGIDKTLTPNEWHHIVLSYRHEDNYTEIFVDGERFGGGQWTNPLANIDASDDIYLGYYPGSTNYSGNFKGKMDEFRITNTTTSCFAAEQNSDCAFAAEDPRLELYYQFDQEISNPAVTTLNATVGPNGNMENFAYTGTESNFIVESPVMTTNICGDVLESKPVVSVVGVGEPIEDGDWDASEEDGTDFGEVFIGQSKMVTFEVKNEGNAVLTIDTIRLGNSFGTPTFVLDQVYDDIMVAANGSLTFAVTYTPDDTWADGQYLYIETDDCVVMTFNFRIEGQGVELPGNACAGAINIDTLLGQTPGEAQVSGLFDNTGYASVDDPETGFGCFEDVAGLSRTIWYTFQGDGNTYRIRTVQCNATDYIDAGDTQAAVYTGDCMSLTPAVCNEDESYPAQLNALIELETEVDSTYYMLIDGFGARDGEFCLEITQVVDVTTVTFQVDATNLVDAGELSADGMIIAGSFNNFQNLPMTEGADNIWSFTLEVAQNATYEYKFKNGLDGWENIDTSLGENCATGDSGNRVIEVGDMPITTDLVCFNYCVSCITVDTDEATLESSIAIFPNPVTDILNVSVDLPQAASNLNIRLTNAFGQVVSEQYMGQLQSDNIELDLSEMPAGAYLLQITDGQSQFTQPVIVQQ